MTWDCSEVRAAESAYAHACAAEVKSCHANLVDAIIRKEVAKTRLDNARCVLIDDKKVKNSVKYVEIKK